MPGISAILTAAGESARMGRPKALLPWRGVTLLEHQIRTLTDAGTAEVVVVLGHQADAVAPYVQGQGVRWVTNPDYRLGKTTSIKAGLQAIAPDAAGILLLAVDQPRTQEIIARVIGAHVEADAFITSPRFQGRGGHPLVFSLTLKDELERISEDKQGIREVLQAHRGQVTEVEFDDPMVRLDINTRQEYEEAKKQYGV